MRRATVLGIAFIAVLVVSLVLSPEWARTEATTTRTGPGDDGTADRSAAALAGAGLIL